MEHSIEKAFTRVRQQPAIHVTLLWVMVMSLASATFAAGGAGHYYIARVSAERIMQSPDVPSEFKEALKDPSCLNSFCNGAIAPDLESLVEEAHHGRTTRIFGKLLDNAEVAYEEAERLPDSDPAKPGRIREAMKGICFTIGWLSHCATDLAIHPKVNARCGDAYEFCDAGKKAVHATAEVQFTRHLTNTYKKPDYKIAFDIPYWLVCKSTGATEQKLQADVKVMRMKLMAEVTAAGRVELSKADLQKEWQAIAQKSIEDTVRFAADPGLFKSYDLDYGEIATDDFRGLREECIAINGGKVPEQWGRQYLNWWQIVQPLSPQERHAQLIELIRGRQPDEPGTKEVLVKTSGPIYHRTWVNDREITQGKNHIVKVPKSGILRIRALAEGSNRIICTQPNYQGENVNVLKQSPYELHYTSNLYGNSYEFRCRVLSENYTWKPQAGEGKVTSSGLHTNVRNDVFDWKVPAVTGGASKLFSIDIQSDAQWTHYATTMSPQEQALSESLKMRLLVEVEPD